MVCGLDGMASCCNVHGEKEVIVNVTAFVVRVWGGHIERN